MYIPDLHRSKDCRTSSSLMRRQDDKQVSTFRSKAATSNKGDCSTRQRIKQNTKSDQRGIVYCNKPIVIEITIKNILIPARQHLISRHPTTLIGDHIRTSTTGLDRQGGNRILPMKDLPPPLPMRSTTKNRESPQLFFCLFSIALKKRTSESKRDISGFHPHKPYFRPYIFRTT